jgi:hypothetical protein
MATSSMALEYRAAKLALDMMVGKFTRDPLGLLEYRPRQLLEKAKGDLLRLDSATFAGDEIACTDAVLDASVAVYHVKDWIGAIPATALPIGRSF